MKSHSHGSIDPEPLKSFLWISCEIDGPKEHYRRTITSASMTADYNGVAFQPMLAAPTSKISVTTSVAWTEMSILGAFLERVEPAVNPQGIETGKMNGHRYGQVSYMPVGPLGCATWPTRRPTIAIGEGFPSSTGCQLL